MHLKTFLSGFLLLLPFLQQLHSQATPQKPNFLIINVDDMGWAQPSCYGGTLAPTPHIDSIATNGIRFTNGYSSSCVCSPSRVGLVTGRTPARSGHDNLTVPKKPETQLDLSEITIAQRIKEVGYTTGIVGKWHLGAAEPKYLPGSRGFDFSIGSTGNVNEGTNGDRYYHDTKLVPDLQEGTDTIPVYLKEANQFFEANQSKPWLLYWSCNNLHGPVSASAEYEKKFENFPEKQKRMYAACISELDDAVGSMLAKLRELHLEENTLIFFVSDNGASSPLGEMGELRGKKWLLWEGGIRVPFIAQWKGRIPAGRISNEPVIQLDFLPTMLAAAGSAAKPEWNLDGTNLLPLLENKVEKLEPRALCWRYGPQYAIREGDWKIVKAADDMKPMLINLATDIGEKNDLTAVNPEKAQKLQEAWNQWNEKMKPARWEDPRSDGHHTEEKKKKKEKDEKEGEK